MFILSFVTFFPRMLQTGSDWPQWFHSMCINFGRILYPFATTLIVGPSLLGVQGSFFRTLLDTRLFNFLSRISYSMYLVHGMAIFYINWGNRNDQYLSIVNTYILTLAAIAITVLFAFLLTLILELPFRKLWLNNDPPATLSEKDGKEGKEEKEGALLKGSEAEVA